MLIIRRETAVYTMAPDNAPVARIAGGETLIFETSDCFGGQIIKETDKMGALDWSRINPATGPVFVEGALPGDTLKVEILKIDLAQQAAMVEAPGEGITGLQAAEESTKILKIEGDQVVFNEKISLPVCPMTDAPLSCTSPPVGVISPAMILNSVDLPQPLGPSSDTNAPRGIWKLTFLTAVKPPRNTCVTLRTSRQTSFIRTPPPPSVTAFTICRRCIDVQGYFL